MKQSRYLDTVLRLVLKHKYFFIIVVALILVKVIWVSWSCHGTGTFESEKTELLQRRNHLVGKIMTQPLKLIES